MRIQPATSEHLAFVLDSWLRSYAGSQDCVGLRHDVYQTVERDRIARCLRCGLWAATHEDDPGLVIGWCCGTSGPPARVHYVYVKSRYRRAGLARELVNVATGGAAVVRYSHRGRVRVPRSWIYEPV